MSKWRTLVSKTETEETFKESEKERSCELDPAWLVAQMVKRLPTMRETWIQSLGWEDLLEKEMATHSSILAWKIPWMEDPVRLQSMGSQRVRHDWATLLSISLLGMESWVEGIRREMPGVSVLVHQSCPTLWDPSVANQASLSMEFSRQEYWSRWPFPSPGPWFELSWYRLQQYVNRELPDVQAGFRKGRGTRDQIAIITLDHWKSKRLPEKHISALLTMPKPLTVWITVNCGKFWKRWEYQTTWFTSWETYMQVRKQQLELDME